MDHTDILILQHPMEFRQRNSVSTVPLLSLVLQNVRVVVGESLHHDDVATAISSTNYAHRLLLFPGEGAIALDSPEGRAFAFA